MFGHFPSRGSPALLPAGTAKCGLTVKTAVHIKFFFHLVGMDARIGPAILIGNY
jgi:hypothetical protein